MKTNATMAEWFCFRTTRSQVNLLAERAVPENTKTPLRMLF